MNARVADVLFTCEYFKHITNIISILLRHFTFTSVHMESKTADYYHVHLYIYIYYIIVMKFWVIPKELCVLVVVCLSSAFRCILLVRWNFETYNIKILCPQSDRRTILTLTYCWNNWNNYKEMKTMLPSKYLQHVPLLAIVGCWLTCHT